MHEISLCENIRSQLDEEATRHKFRRVTKVWLDVGAFSCVEPEALRFGFDAVMRGSVAEGAELEIEVKAGKAQCTGCGTTTGVSDRLALCPDCGAPLIYAGDGDELRIKKVEVV